MTQRPPAPEQSTWKLIAFGVGIGGGALFGALAALLYTRAAQTSMANRGKLPSISTMSMIGLSISLIGIVRQIVELGSED